MYKEFFGLKEHPFRLSCDPDLLLLTAQHREALVGLSYAILDGREFAVLVGEAGTGKTTLLARIFQNLPHDRVRSSIVYNPTLTRDEFLELVMLNFGFEEVPASKAQRLVMLQKWLLAGFAAKKNSVLVVDEAHQLSPQLLEEIRLLSNFDHGGRKLLQIVLVGQPEMDELLNRNDLRQLKQRISLRFTLKPFASSSIDAYIQHRWSKCGGDRHPFTAEAVAMVAQASNGIPRVVNAICENAVLAAFVAQSRDVQTSHVTEACRDLRLNSAPALAVAANGSAAHRAPAGAAVPPASRAPAISPPHVPFILPTLERQNHRGGSLLARWFGKLGFASEKV